jgi:hypothetical protein
MSLNPPHAIRFGTVFRNQKLYHFSSEGIMVLSQWPDMRAWRRTPKGRQWTQIRPHLRLSRFEDSWTCEIYRRESKIRSYALGGHIRDLLLRDPDHEELALDMRPELREELITDPVDRQPMESPSHLAFTEPLWVTALKAEYLNPIPQDVLASVAPFSSRHWHLLNLVSRCPGALDLLRSTPALGFALASLWAFRRPAPRQPLRSARALLSKRQPAIASWLGFPSDRSALRVLRKVSPAECTIPNLLHLRDLLTVQPKPLRHMRVLSTASIHIMACAAGRYVLSDVYLCELGACPQPYWLETEQSLIRDVLWMRETLGETGILMIHSHAHLQRRHDRLVERMGRMDLKLLDPEPFPEPPFPGIITSDLNLELLKTPAELIIEGRAQLNCVGAYAKRICRGGLYIYRVLAPERATLAIARNSKGTWRISELKAPANAEVMDSTRQSIESWVLHQHS